MSFTLSSNNFKVKLYAIMSVFFRFFYDAGTAVVRNVRSLPS